MEQKPFISVIIPTYNEAPKEKEMEEHLNSISEYFEKIGKSYEVVIVLDGPTDKTPENQQGRLPILVEISRII